MIHDFDDKLQQQIDRCGSIRHRLEAQMKIVTSIQSELDTTTSFVEMLKTQKSLAQAKFDQLHGLLHPIRRCPTDILQHIFEWTFECAGDRSFQAATNLSHVCRGWRTVALRTPFLWTKMRIPVNSDSEDIADFWHQNISRLKGVPPLIVLDNIKGTVADLNIVRWCRFTRFPKIEQIRLNLMTTRAASRLLKDNVGLGYKGDLQCLFLQGPCPEEYDGNAIELSDLINRFPTTSSISLYKFSNAIFASPITFENIQKLIVKDSSFLLSKLMQALPSTPNVEFLDVKFDTELNRDFICPKIQSLSVQDVENVPWSYLKTPALTDFALKIEVNDPVMDFISAHPSIQSLDTGYSQGHIDSILSHLPLILSYNVACDQDLEDFAKEEIHGLRELGIYQDRGDDFELTLELFETIVRNCFLQELSENDSGRTEPLTTLKFFSECGYYSGDEEWCRSELFLSAAKEIYVIERWGTKYQTCSLKWT